MNLERIVSDWLHAEAPRRAPEGLLDRTLDRVAVTSQERVLWRRASVGRGRSSRPLLALAATVVALSVLGALAVVGGRPDRSASISAERMNIVEQVVEAINARDVTALRSSFTADAILEFPSVDARSGRVGEVYMSDWDLGNENFPEAWMSALDKWGLEARLGSCRTQAESTISCAVVTRWHVLQLEIGEEWTYDFDGARLRRLEMVRVDPDPSDMELTLGLPDLERWEAWLRETHPEQADRLLSTGPDLFGHFYFRFGGSPDEIGASIDEYWESRDRLVGTYVCSEDGNPDATHTWDVREDGTIIRGSDETGEALAAGTWSRDKGRLWAIFGGGGTSFAIRGDRLIGPTAVWICTRDSSR